ncbi:UNVERIFIED_CONTAM: hypothetical protein NCL1_29941 [Trichonephila clavipes]
MLSSEHHSLSTEHSSDLIGYHSIRFNNLPLKGPLSRFAVWSREAVIDTTDYALQIRFSVCVLQVKCIT